jgi:hypothetical protein
MTYSLTWLPEVLQTAGLKVALVDGWKDRGFGNVDPILGVICHHTGTPNPKKFNFPTKGGLTKGVWQKKSDGTKFFLEGPLCQLALALDGTYYVVAAGRANHAGKGEWKGVKTGNASFIGIEAENDGTPAAFPWPEVQMDAYRRGVAAILRHIGRSADHCCGHREWAPKRKDDPLFDMNVFRLGVAAILDGTAPPPVLIPIVEPGGKNRPTLRRGMSDKLVPEIQRKLGVSPQADSFGPKTEAAVRELQRKSGMVADGIVGPKTWQALDRIP